MEAAVADNGSLVCSVSYGIMIVIAQIGMLDEAASSPPMCAAKMHSASEPPDKLGGIPSSVDEAVRGGAVRVGD